MSEREAPPLRVIYWYLTGGCNLRCRHCWIDPAFGEGGRHRPWAALRPVIEEARTLGLVEVKLTGGEPLLHPEFGRILADLQAMGLTIRVETNGTLLGTAEARALRAAGADVSLSIDAPSATLHDDLRGVPGAFEGALRGARHLRAAGLPFQMIACLYRANAGLVGELADLAAGLGACSVKLNPITGDGRSGAMAAGGELLTVAEVLALYRQLAGRAEGPVRILFDVPPAFKPLSAIRRDGLGTCGILTILGLLHDGRAGLCGIGEHVPALDFGSLLAPGAVRRVWEGNETLLALRRDLPGRLGGVCGRCLWRNYCLGKCVAHNFTQAGDLLAGHPFCEEALAAGLFPAGRLVEHRF